MGARDDKRRERPEPRDRAELIPDPANLGRQLPLDFQHRPARSREDLIVTGSLAAAIGLIERWPNWPTAVVVLCGPSGSGKSHLAAVWAEAAEPASVSAQPHGRDRALAAASAGPILIEDIDRDGFDETTLFHLINAACQAGTHVMMTSRLRPAAWQVALPDLRSRLTAATVVDIDPPDDALLAQVIFKLFADRQIAVEPKVVGFLLSRMERSLDAAQAVVEAIDRMAMARGVRISRTLAGEALTLIQRADSGEEPS